MPQLNLKAFVSKCFEVEGNSTLFTVKRRKQQRNLHTDYQLPHLSQRRRNKLDVGGKRPSTLCRIANNRKSYSVVLNKQSLDRFMQDFDLFAEKCWRQPAVEKMREVSSRTRVNQRRRRRRRTYVRVRRLRRGLGAAPVHGSKAVDTRPVRG